jgi:hypothetical protein
MSDIKSKCCFNYWKSDWLFLYTFITHVVHTRTLNDRYGFDPNCPPGRRFNCNGT